MKRRLTQVAVISVCAGVISTGTACAVGTASGRTAAGASIAVDSFTGPVTHHEVDSFTTYVRGLTPAADNIGNNWAQGPSGEQTKAMSLVYEISHSSAVLDQMIRFCDAVLSERNDLASAPVGHHVVWTGGVDPVWPNSVTTSPIGTGGEQGDPVGHLGDCARLITQTPALWNKTVPIGDPNHYGSTYLARAKTFLAGGDTAIDKHILARLLNTSNGDRQYFAPDSPYMGSKPVPWNQQMMFDYGFENLAIAHQILGDAPARVARYDGLVQASVNWFFGQVTKYADPAGRTAYNWAYTPSATGGEDSNHGSLDVAGFYRAYLTGRYKISAAMMTPFANTFADVMIKGVRHYAGRVDGTDGTGHGGPTTWIRSGYLLLADFRPDDYLQMMGADLTQGSTTGSIDQFSRFLLVKDRRAHGK
jgi:hypothetical protein